MIFLLAAEEIKEAHPITVSQSFLVFLIGLAIVVAVLALLVGIIYFFRLLAPKTALKSETAVNSAGEELDEQTVAAIGACIACILSAESEEKIVPPFIIKNIKHY